MIKDILQGNANVTPNDNEMAILREYFPSCFKSDGSFDLVRFSEFLKDKIDVTQEGYELKFLGKNYARMLASLNTETVLVPDEAHNALPENANSESIYISGDNLDGLKHLLKSYAGKVKCIYIDPPYNTGTDGFVYNDKFTFTVEELTSRLSIDEEQAARILDLARRGSASHSAWLMFMYPRLQLAKELLSKGGAIFIAIDDNEYANLRLICDDIFGEENFVSSMVWAAGRKNDSTFISNSHEYMLCYAPDKQWLMDKKVEWSTKKAGLEDIYGEERYLFSKYGTDYGAMERELREWYSNLDDSAPAKRHSHYKCIDRKGIYFPSDISWPGGGGPKYEVIHPVTQKPCKVPERGWVYPSPERMQELIEADLIHFGEDETTVPCNKTYLHENEYEVPYSVFYKDGRAATKRLKALMAEGVFTNPKDEYILEQLFAFVTDSDSLIVDFFSGSASTAHAIMNMNCRDINSKRKFIVVQLPENLDQKYEKASAADKKRQKKVLDFLDSVGRPHFLDEVGQERIIRAAAKIREEHPDTAADLGFKHYTIREVSQTTLDKIEKFDNSGFVTDTTVYDEFGASTILTTWLVRDGYSFVNRCEMLDLAGYTAYWCENHLYLIEPVLTEDAVKALIDKYSTQGGFNPQNIVVFGYSFNFVEMENLKTNVKILRDSEKNLKVNLDIRY